MIRVLHLLESAADFQSERGAAHLTQNMGDGFESHARTIGPGGDFGNLPAAILALRRWRGPQIDIVHAWGHQPMTVAAMAGIGRVVFSPPPLFTRRAIEWTRAVQSYRDLHVICPTATMRRISISRGLPPNRCHLIRPGVDFGRIRRRRDGELRAALGFAQDDYVLLAPGESTRAAAHRDAMWATGILHVLDPRFKILLWGRGPETKKLGHLIKDFQQPELLRQARIHLGRPVEFEELLSAADAVLISAKGAVATLPISICMAAGLPTIATVTYSVSELLEDRHTAVMVAPGSIKLMAQRILDLRADSTLQWSISDMARTEAYEFFSLTRFLTQYRTLYRQIAGGQPVEVPEQSPGAGMRFHGRG